jgi:hypothetical protein
MTMKRDSPGPLTSEPPRKKPLAMNPHGQPRFQGCEQIRAYDLQGKLGEGTFGCVLNLCERDCDRNVNHAASHTERYTKRVIGAPESLLL